MIDIRLAKKNDTGEMLEIYGPLIKQSSTSFEMQVPTVEEFYNRMIKIQLNFPWLVCEWERRIAGYTYAGPHRTREAYQWSVELSVYVHPTFHHQGVATALYNSLIAILKLQGFCNALAGIALPNAASVRFHESMGFKPVGVYHNVGFKMGKWHAVGWWEMPISSLDVAPATPLGMRQVQGHDSWVEALKSGLVHIKR